VAWPDGLLFHELVHVGQYPQLGIPPLRRALRSWIPDGGGYDGIPLEVSVYTLEGGFRQRPGRPFSVEVAVAEWIQDGRF
jgi:hypothetical protein